MRKFLAALALLATSLFFGAYLISAALASRNSTGTYSLAQPPFISGTVINSGTMNSQFSDLGTALTDSLSRSGSGGMLAPLGLTDGTVTSPSLKFNNEAGTGFYRAGAGDLRAAIAGLDVGQWNAGAFRTGDGTLAAPAHSFISETGTGWYKAGASNPALSVAGTKRLECTTTGCIVTGTLSTTTSITAATLNTTGVASFNGVIATPAAGATVRTASTATQANITGAVGNNALAIESSHTINNFLPGLIWFTSDNNATIPKAGVYVKDTAAGSVLNLGTSNNYATGITANATVDQTGMVTAPGGVTIGTGGTAISGSFAGSSAWTPGSIAAGSTAGITITVTGAAAGAPCAVGSPTPNTALILWCWATANVCNLQLSNNTAAPVTGSAGTYSCRVFNP